MKDLQSSDKETGNMTPEKNEKYELVEENSDIQIKAFIGGIAHADEIEKFFDKLESIKPVDKKFDEYVIAYIDFLGVKGKMQGDNSYDALQKLRFLLFGSKKVANYIGSINKVGDYFIRIFSDNIVIAQKFDEEKAGDQIISIIDLIINIQFEASLQFDFLLRGGITVGELYIDDSIVWGSGLIEAYEIESKLANYPRVIISDKLIKVYERCQKKTLNLYASICQDFDGLWFLNFLLAFPNLKNIPIISETLKEIRKSYEKEDDSVKQKFNWVITFFNTHCKNFKDRVEDYDKYILPLLDLDGQNSY